MADITHKCMRTDGYGLHAAILAAGRDVAADIAQRDILAQQAVMNICHVKVIGAHVAGTTMDRTKLVTVILSMGASLYHVFATALHSVEA